jgi:hypothetical protein
LLLLALVPRTLRGVGSFEPHVDLAGAPTAGFHIVMAALPWQLPTLVNAGRSRWIQSLMAMCGAALLLASAASDWVYRTLDAWLLTGLSVLLLLVAACRLLVIGARELRAGMRARLGWNVVPRVVRTPANERESDPGDDPIEELGRSALARLLPWWAAAVLRVGLGLLVMALLLGAVLHGGWAASPSLLLQLLQAIGYVVGAGYLVARLIFHAPGTGRLVFGYWVGVVIAIELGTPEPIELWNDLADHLRW